MKSYTKVYMRYFGFVTDDFIPCEVCDKKAVDIAHIQSQKRRPDLKNDITNLMAMCREDHIFYGDNNLYIDFLQEIHNEKMKGV